MLWQALLFHTDNHEIVKILFMSQPSHIPIINSFQDFWLKFSHNFFVLVALVKMIRYAVD